MTPIDPSRIGTAGGSVNRPYQKTNNLLPSLPVDKIDIYDVAIIGGGPADSTAATLLAKAGRRVVPKTEEMPTPVGVTS